MAQVTDRKTEEATYYGFMDSAPRVVCNQPTLNLIAGPVEYTRKLQEVTSERRPMPKNPVLPNKFEVHKYLASTTTDDFCIYCNSDYFHTVKFTEIRAQFRPLLHCAPQDLCGLYKNYTENAIADVFAKANSPAIFDSAPVLAELLETLFWLGSIFNGMKAVVALLFTGTGGKKLLRAIKEGVSSPESLWLEYRYALMPFILTINDLIKAYKGGIVRETYDARIEYIRRHRYNDSSWVYGGVAPFNVYNDVVDTISATARLTVKSQCDPAPYGMGSWDWVRAAYEVTPLSFVLNWIIGIEEWLESIRDTELVLEHSHVTTVIDRKGHIRANSVGPIKWIKPPNWLYTEYMMRRTPNIVPPTVPLLQAEKLSLLRTVDALSLTVGFIKGFLAHKKN